MVFPRPYLDRERVGKTDLLHGYFACVSYVDAQIWVDAKHFEELNSTTPSLRSGEIMAGTWGNGNLGKGVTN